MGARFLSGWLALVCVDIFFYYYYDNNKKIGNIYMYSILPIYSKSILYHASSLNTKEMDDG